MVSSRSSIEIAKPALDVGEHRVASRRTCDVALGELRRREMFLERDLAGRPAAIAFAPIASPAAIAIPALMNLDVAPSDVGDESAFHAAAMVTGWFHLARRTDARKSQVCRGIQETLVTKG